MRRQLGAGVRPGSPCMQSFKRMVPFAMLRFPQPSATAVPFLLGGGGGEPCASVCTEGPAATSQLHFIHYKVSPCSFLAHPCGLGNNIGDTIFFLSKRKINRL